MRLITLLTDYHFKDYYLAKVKSRLFKCYPKDHILDICHEIPHFNLEQAAYAFNAMLPEFNDKGLHFIFIHLHYNKNYSIIVANTKTHGTIVAPNNGILGLLQVEFIDFFELNVLPSPFVELAIIEQVSKTELPSLKRIKDPFFLKNKEIRYREKEMTGEIIYTDTYGNSIVNIKRADFDAFTANSIYQIVIRREIIESLSEDYSDNRDAGLVVFFNEQGYLEIANNSGNSEDLLGLKAGMKINIKKN